MMEPTLSSASVEELCDELLRRANIEPGIAVHALASETTPEESLRTTDIRCDKEKPAGAVLIGLVTSKYNIEKGEYEPSLMIATCGADPGLIVSLHQLMGQDIGKVLTAVVRAQEGTPREGEERIIQDLEQTLDKPSTESEN